MSSVNIFEARRRREEDEEEEEEFLLILLITVVLVVLLETIDDLNNLVRAGRMTGRQALMIPRVGSRSVQMARYAKE